VPDHGVGHTPGAVFIILEGELLGLVSEKLTRPVLEVEVCGIEPVIPFVEDALALTAYSCESWLSPDKKSVFT
jgi:hypothetical protein